MRCRVSRRPELGCRYGAEHEDTLTSKSNLANCLRAAGQYAEAAELHREARAAEGSSGPHGRMSRSEHSERRGSRGQDCSEATPLPRSLRLAAPAESGGFSATL